MSEATLQQDIAVVAEAWADSPYYADAEQWTFLFWNADTPFRRLFDRLDLTEAVELACGHGRHAAQAAPLAGRLTLVDIFEQNLAACRQRLVGRGNVAFLRGNGQSFQPLADGSVTAIYCYDAMVHFSPAMVQAYLRDAARILKPRGMALFHHSNYAAPNEQHYGLNPHARNSMTLARFAGFAAEAGLAVVESLALPWGGVDDLDGLTLLRRPG